MSTATKKTKATKSPKAEKPAKAPKAPKLAKPKKLSGLDAAAKVLHDAGVAMNVKAIMAEIHDKSLWKSNGATPEATVYAAMIREIAAKGKESRFKKTERGMFISNKAG